jgi:hypothetical protein
VKNSKESWKGVKKLSKFHHFLQRKMSEKQIIFFTVNCAGKFESANQWTIHPIQWLRRVGLVASRLLNSENEKGLIIQDATKLHTQIYDRKYFFKQLSEILTKSKFCPQQSPCH